MRAERVMQVEDVCGWGWVEVVIPDGVVTYVYKNILEWKDYEHVSV